MNNIGLINLPKMFWTRHARSKMKQYGLSEQRVKRVANHPERVEEGVAPRTTAAMQKAGTSKKHHEIWVMFQEVKLRNEKQKRIISAWRYPGTTEPGRPLPQEIISEIEQATEAEE